MIVFSAHKGGLEMHARATLANLERELHAAGAEVTIHALWVALADRAGLRHAHRIFSESREDT